MKVGIITYHFAHNFGAALQCYCLQEFLNNHGYDVEIINYCPKGITRYYTVFSNPFTTVHYRYEALRNQGMAKNPAKARALLSLARVIKDNKRICFRFKRKRAFERFSSKYFNLTDTYYTYTDLEKNCSEFDALICGSDQVWNIKLLNDSFDKAYFLKFASGEQIKIAYAPSFGETDPRLHPEIIAEYLTEFKAISVRERQDVSKLEAVLKRKVSNVLDPVFLANVKNLKKIVHTVRVESEPYILIYALFNDDKIFEVARRIYAGCKIIDISPIDISWDSSILIKNSRSTIGPDEFLTLMYNSQCVLTNSFHGTALSIILHKNFYVFPLKLRNERIQNILEITNLERRFVYNIEELDDITINYKQVDERLNLARSKSKAFLLESLAGTRVEERYVPAATNIELRELRQGADCCGCGACVSVCRHGAISFIKDNEGFNVPIVDSDKCIHCNLCIKACNLSHNRSNDHEALKIFAFQNSRDVRLQSASGGAWKALAIECVAKKGVAVGAVWSPDYLSVTHFIAKNEEEVATQSGSKYIEGTVIDTFHQIEFMLNEGKEVIFSGTPCQCSALKAYLELKRVEKKDLILVDLICHGKSSPAIWNSYVHYIENKFNGKVKGFTFRDKTQSWSGIHEEVIFENGLTVRLTPETHSIGKIMETESMLRPSCYNCPFAKLTRIGDITIGDFWGIEKELPAWDNRLGTSLIFTNTERGISFLQRVFKGNYKTQEIKKLQVIQPNLRVPTACPADRNAFWEQYHHAEENAFIAKFSQLKNTDKLKMKLKSLIYKLK